MMPSKRRISIIPNENSAESIGGHNGVQDFSTQIIVEMLGLDIPGMGPSGYHHGYQLWPPTSGHEWSSTPLVFQSIFPLQIPTQLDYSESQVDAQGRLNNWAMSFSGVPAVNSGLDGSDVGSLILV